jgi:UrcA family protein
MLRFHSHSIAAFGATLVLAVGTAVAAPPAHAAPTAGLEAKTKAVSFGDLDLTRPKGVRALKRRVADAVERVCDHAKRMTVYEQQVYRVCAAEATADAHAQVERAVQVALNARDLTTASR